MQPIESLEPRRLFAAGAIDTTYGGGDGTVDVRFNTHGWAPVATDVAADGRGRLMVAGLYGGKRNVFSVARATADGSADASFGTGGIASVKLPLNRTGIFQILADRSGRTLVLLSTSAGTTVTRLTERGVPDPKFGKNGTAAVPIVASARDLAVDAGNNVFVVGTSRGKTGDRGTIVRLTYRGKLDKAFGSGGAYKTPVPQDASYRKPGNAAGVAARVLDDGRIVGVAELEYDYADSAGSDLSSTTFAISAFRLNPNGKLDATYGQNGSAAVAERQDDVTVADVRLVAIRADGSVVTSDVNGSYDAPDPPFDEFDDGHSFIAPDGTVASRGERLQPDGAIDAPAPEPGPDADEPEPFVANVVAVQDDGRLIVTAGQRYGANATTYRLTDDLNYDPTFVATTVVGRAQPDYGSQNIAAGGRLLIVRPTYDAQRSATVFSSATIVAIDLT